MAQLLTLDEAAHRLGLDRVARDPRRTVLTMIRRGEIRGVRVGRWMMVDPVSLDAYVSAKAQ